MTTVSDLLMRAVHAVGRSNISTSTGYHNNNNMSVGPRLPGAYMTAPVASIIMISFRGANDSLPATPVRVAKLNWSEGCLQFSVL